MTYSYKQLVQHFEPFCASHYGIKRFYSTVEEQIQNVVTPDDAFPVVTMTPVSSTLGDTISHTVRISVWDRLDKDRANEGDVMSDLNSILNDIRMWFGPDNDLFTRIVITQDPTSYPLNNRLLDFCYGWTMDVTIDMENWGFCSIPLDGAISPLPDDPGYPSEPLGWSGVSGFSGFSGVSGYSGNSTSGYSGFSGVSGYSGVSGFSGVNLSVGTVILYPTTAVGDFGYNRMVTDVNDPDYDSPAADVPTGAITTTNQLVATLIADANIFLGNPGVVNVTTIGNIRRTSGSGTATFYFELYHRDLGGTETLIGTSLDTLPVDTAIYVEYDQDALLGNGNWIATDRIVVKYYANRIAGGSNPSYEFQFGGLAPVRSLIPIPFNVMRHNALADIQGGQMMEYYHLTSAQNAYVADVTVNDYWTIELIDVLTTDFYAPYAMTIDSVSNVLNSPTTTILDDGAAYTLGVAITAGSKITVTVDLAAVITLNATKL